VLTTEKSPNIKVWAAIKGVKDKAAPHIPVLAVQGHPRGVYSKLYDSGALRHMSSHHKHFLTY